jgi:multidrug efflux system membrane fusion protein
MGPSRLQAPPPRRRPAWRTALWIALAVVVALILGLMLTHPKAAKGGRSGGRRPPTVIGVATAQLGDIPVTLTELGTVTPIASVTVQSQIAGVLQQVYFKEGQMVKAGQLLALVDPRPYQIALQQAEGQLLRDQALLANAKVDLTRYRTLLAQDSIQAQQVDTQAALVRQDEGVVKTDQAAVASAKLNIAYCHIIAPVSGRVGLRQVDPGNYITAGSTNGVVVITTLDPIDIEFSVPEDNIPQIAARVASGATLTATALDRSGQTDLGDGALLTLDNQVDASTGTVKAKARFHNPSGELFPNQFVNLKLLVDTKTGQVVVPTQSVRHGPNGDYVFTVVDGTAKMNVVKVGLTDGERTAIVSGLQVGDQVITDGGDRLADGATVLLPGQTPPGNRKPKAGGPFAWLFNLFGHKSQDGGDQPAAAGGASSGTEAAGASGAPGQGGGGGHGAGRMQAMLQQLDLTPQQKAQADPILADMREKVAAAGDDPDARRAAMRDGMQALSAILTDAQKAKLAQLRAAARAAGGYGGAGNGGGAAGPPSAAGSDNSAPANPPPSHARSRAQPQGAADSSAAPSQAAPSAAAEPPAAAPAGGDRMARMADFLGLDADQRAKAKAIFADGPSPEAFAKFRAILTPEQQAKLAARRAQRQAERSADQ